MVVIAMYKLILAVVAIAIIFIYYKKQPGEPVLELTN